jgi:hypothetical protein
MSDLHASGVVENLPVLDLTHATWEEDLAGIDRIANVGAVVVPENLAHALPRISMQNVGAVIPVPAGAHVRVHTGAIMLGGDALADPGGDNEVLIVIGALVITSPVTRIGYREVIVTGLLIAPKGSESAVGAGLTRMTGSVSYYQYAEGQEFRHLTGQSRLSGESIANPGGSRDDVLLLIGQVIITSPVTHVGYQRVIYTGQLLAPRASEDTLAPALSGSGQVCWYAGAPRFMVGDDVLGRAYFELLDDPIALTVVGSVRIEDDVSPGLFRAKVSEITVVGDLTAPKHLIPVLQVLTTEQYGEVAVASDDADHTATAPAGD